MSDQPQFSSSQLEIWSLLANLLVFLSKAECEMEVFFFILFLFFPQQMAPQAPACLSYAKAMGSFIHLLNVHKEWFFMKGFCLPRNLVTLPHHTSQLI